MANIIGTCARCKSPLEQGDLRCAICGTAVPPSESAQAQAKAVQVMRCNGCGAAVSYSVEKQAPHCDFCGSVMEVETVTDPMEQTEHYLPFTVPGESARKSLKRWLGSLGFFRPSDLKQSAKMEELKPLWWVGWVFDAKALISWTADSNAGSGRAAWAPHSGQCEMKFDDIAVSASRGLSDAETQILAGSYDLSTAGAEPSGAEGTTEPTIEQFDAQRSVARARIAQAIDNLAAELVKQSEVPGKKHRKVHVAAMLKKLETARYAFPAYVMAYRYKDKLYRAVISGQDEKVLKGDAPLSWTKIMVTIGVSAAVIVGIILAIIFATRGGGGGGY